MVLDCTSIFRKAHITSSWGELEPSTYLPGAKSFEYATETLPAVKGAAAAYSAAFLRSSPPSLTEYCILDP